MPSLGAGSGYWVTFTTVASGPVSAGWSAAARTSLRVVLYAGNPFAGKADPLKANPPAGALATMTSTGAAVSVSVARAGAGTYTALFYAPNGRAKSVGSVTGLRGTCP